MALHALPGTRGRDERGFRTPDFPGSARQILRTHSRDPCVVAGRARGKDLRLGYAINPWAALNRDLDDGRLAIDNVKAERARSPCDQRRSIGWLR